jgi:ABC-type antimicrobial peptide transport system permease subunit
MRVPSVETGFDSNSTVTMKVALDARYGRVDQRRSSVMRSVLGQGVTLALLGIAAGAASSWALARLMARLLFDLKPPDAPTFFAAGLLFFAVAIAACYVPARRATRIDPMAALRYE